MGLSISAYATIKPSTEAAWDSVQDGSVVHLWNAQAFVSRGDGIAVGHYEVGATSAHGFNAGSYTGYSEWRRQLAQLVGTTPEDVWGGAEVPFAELINFSDCDGFIGPVTSAKLAKDFADWQARAETFAETLDGFDRSWFIARYADWRISFDIAARGGVVVFH